MAISTTIESAEKIETLIRGIYHIRSKQSMAELLKSEQKEWIRKICTTLLTIPRFDLDSLLVTCDHTLQVHFNLYDENGCPLAYWRLDTDCAVRYCTLGHSGTYLFHNPDFATIDIKNLLNNLL